jgi:hypothetical protein
MRLTYLIPAVLAGSCFVLSCTSEPRLKVANDPFPSGQNSPEGVASDFARAFIRRDAGLFRRITIPPYGGDETRSKYVLFLQETSDTFANKARGAQASPQDPQKITKVFAARHLSKNGPRSYGNAAFGFTDVMFVDVEVLLNDGRSFVKRTLVIKDRDAKWYVHPLPTLSPLLSAGWEQETVSSQTFSVPSEALANQRLLRHSVPPFDRVFPPPVISLPSLQVAALRRSRPTSGRL